jgi:hypothetical protein
MANLRVVGDWFTFIGDGTCEQVLRAWITSGSPRPDVCWEPQCDLGRREGQASTVAIWAPLDQHMRHTLS